MRFLMRRKILYWKLLGFAPEIIAGKSRQYGFGSDSSFRFERGVDYRLQADAIVRATDWCCRFAVVQPVKWLRHKENCLRQNRLNCV